MQERTKNTVDVTLPTRTAGEVTLSDGTRIWLKTLNALQRAEAQSRAELAAVREARPWRRGNEGWQAALEEFAEWGAERQSDYLAVSGDLDGAFAEQVNRQATEPARPERDGREDAAYADLLETWEADCERTVCKRLELMAGLRREARERALAMPAAERMEECAQENWRRTYRAMFGTRMMLETLFRAARRPEERGRPHFAGVEEIADLPDVDCERLLNAYLELDCIQPAEIPTTPPGS
jgi:hypothetical protein